MLLATGRKPNTGGLGLERAGIKGEEVLSFRHGATVSTNAILERKGVKTALNVERGMALIKAIVEASGKSVEDIKAFLDAKLETAKAKGEKLTRQALYASFRNPTSKVGQIIRRLEEEKAAKSSAVDADAVLGELAGV